MAVCVVVLMSTGCAREPLTSVRLSIDDQNVLGVVREGVPVQGIVVFFHGLDRDESILEADEPHRELSATLAEAGYVVVSSRAGGNAFGNASSQRNYEQLAFNTAAHFGTPNIFFLAESMGTVAAVNLMAKRPDIHVIGLAAINPLLNIDSLTPDYRAEATAANSDLAGSNPLALPVSTLADKNFRFYVASDDNLVLTSQNSAVFRERFGAVANISVVKCAGGHLDPACIQGKDIVRWFSTMSRQ